MRIVSLAALALSVAFFASPAQAQSCYQSFDIDMNRSLPDNPVLAPFERLSCFDLERYREQLYITNREDVEAAFTQGIPAWRRVRDRRIADVRAARADYESARTDAAKNAARTLLTHELGMAVAIFGCVGSVGMGCAAGLLLNHFNTFLSLTTGPDAAAESRALDRAIEALEDHEGLSSDAALSAAFSAYETEADRACGIVKDYCMQ